MFVELWNRIQSHFMTLVSFQSSWVSIKLFDSRTKSRVAQSAFWRHSLKPQGHKVTELRLELTWAHCLPAWHFPLEWLCSSEGLRQQRVQNSAVQSGGRTKPIPQGCIIPSAQRGGEDGMVYSDQQGALETDREREEQQKSRPKEQPFKNDFTLQIQLQRQMDFPARLENKL